MVHSAPHQTPFPTPDNESLGNSICRRATTYRRGNVHEHPFFGIPTARTNGLPHDHTSKRPSYANPVIASEKEGVLKEPTRRLHLDHERQGSWMRRQQIRCKRGKYLHLLRLRETCLQWPILFVYAFMAFAILISHS